MTRRSSPSFAIGGATVAAPQRVDLNADELPATRASYRRSAQIAASEGSEALAELLRYSLEGPASYRPFSSEVVEQLAAALKRAAEIEVSDPDCEIHEDERTRLMRLIDTLDSYVNW